MYWQAREIVKRMKRITSILLVENRPADQIAIRHALDSRGIIYAMTVASSAEEALRIMSVSSRAPEIILASHELPEMSGLEFARTIRSNRTYSSCRIFILSSPGSGENRTIPSSAGISGVITKPLQFNCTTSKDMINLMIDLMNG